MRRGQSALAFAAGGPVARVSGLDIPLPYAVARYRYGVDDRLGVYAGGHLLMAAFGVFGFDGGISYCFSEQRGAVPSLSATAGLSGFFEPAGDTRLFPAAELTASCLLGDRFLSYFGFQSMYQLSASPYAVFAPLIGQEVRLGRRFSLGLEAKWYAPGQKTRPRNVDYRLPLGGTGALGFVLGANYHFGGWYE